MKVFLGGTCSDSQWREELKPLLKIDYFDPVVDDWKDEAYRRELHERETADYVLYVITPRMTGVYAIAEAVDDSNKRPAKTVFCARDMDGGLRFDKAQMKSLLAVCALIERNGGAVRCSLEGIARLVNGEECREK